MTTDVRWQAFNIFLSFMPSTLSSKDRWVNTVAERQLLVPGVKDAYRFLNRMYNAGLIDRDFPLYADDDSMYNVVKTGIVGAFGGNWDHSIGIIETLQETVPTVDLVAIDPFRNAAGKTVKPAYDPEGIYFFIPRSSKNPEAAMRYVNWLSRFENYNFLQIGPEGVTHDLVDGLPRMRTVTGPWIQNSGYNMDYVISLNGLELGDPEKNVKVLSFGTPKVDPKYLLNAYEVAMTDARPAPIVIPSSPLTASGPYSQTLTDKAYAFFALAITARPGDFDKVWDDGVRDWLASGAQVVIDERRAKYVEP